VVGGAPWRVRSTSLYRGSGGRAPSGAQGQRGSGGRSPPEAESILVIGCPAEPANLAPVRENSMFCCGPLVSELGGGRVHGAPNPVIGGRAVPPAPLRLRRLCLGPNLQVYQIKTRYIGCSIAQPVHTRQVVCTGCATLA